MGGSSLDRPCCIAGTLVVVLGRIGSRAAGYEETATREVQVKAARWVWIGATLAFLVGVSVSSQEQHFYRVSSGTTSVITAMSPDGWLTWSNAMVGGRAAF